MTEILDSVEEIATRIPDGVLLALPPEYAPCSMEGIRALVRRGARNLRLLGVPQFGFQADLLIGAGCVAEVETAAVTLGELGLAPRFTDAIKSQKIAMRDTTCPAIHAALQASEKGIPFMPLRGLIGSDIVARRDDWQIAGNPFGENDPIVYLPAIRPDATLFHAAKADRQGNVWIGVRRELMVMAHASAAAYVTAEEIVECDLLADPQTAPGTIPGLYITAIAGARNGAWPLGVPHLYEHDREHLALYEEMARSSEGFDAYLDKWVRREVAAE
ncbi:MAG: CoA transferase subunit A [Methyloligellaceae bacterium]